MNPLSEALAKATPWPKARVCSSKDSMGQQSDDHCLPRAVVYLAMLLHCVRTA